MDTIINNLSRECFMKETLSDDVMNLLSMFTMKNRNQYMMDRNMQWAMN